MPKLSAPITIRRNEDELRALDALAEAAGVSRHAVLVCAVEKGFTGLTADEVKAFVAARRQRLPAASVSPGEGG